MSLSLIGNANFKFETLIKETLLKITPKYKSKSKIFIALFVQYIQQQKLLLEGVVYNKRLFKV